MTPAHEALVKEAKAELAQNASLIILHALYQRWGLPTKLLAALKEKP